MYESENSGTEFKILSFKDTTLSDDCELRLTYTWVYPDRSWGRMKFLHLVPMTSPSSHCVSRFVQKDYIDRTWGRSKFNIHLDFCCDV